MASLPRWFATVAALATGSLLLLGLVLWARAGFTTPPYVFMRGPGGMVAFMLGAITQLAAGLVVASRRPDLAIGRLALVFALILATAAAVNAYLTLGEPRDLSTMEVRWIAWLPSAFGFPSASLVAVWLGLVFPDGRLRGTGGLAMLRLTVLGAALTAVATALQPGALVLYPLILNPIEPPPSLRGVTLTLAVVGAALLGVGSIGVGQQLLARYREAGAVVRAQVRWYVATAVCLIAAFISFLLALVVVPNGSPTGEAILVALLLSACLPPIAIVVAISRYHLFDIDTILSRAFVFGSLTAILAGLYTASIRMFNALFTALTGEASDAALVLTTLAIAASFTPIKRRLENVVERRFTSGDAASPESARTLAAGHSPSPLAGTPPALDPAALDRLVAAVLADPAFRAEMALQARMEASPVEASSDDLPA